MDMPAHAGEPAPLTEEITSAEVERTLHIYLHVQSLLETALSRWDKAHPVKNRHMMSEEDVNLEVGEESDDDVVFGHNNPDGNGFVKGALELTNHQEIIRIDQ
jgi:hypothetical protein